MRGQTEEMTVGRQLSYHCPSVVATLKQVELFVWQRGMLEGREGGFYLTERRDKGICKERSADGISEWLKKASQINKKGDFESGSLAGKMSGEGSPCRQVVGDDALTRLP